MGSDPATQQDPIPQKQQDPILEAACAVIWVAFGEGLVIRSVKRHYGWLRFHL